MPWYWTFNSRSCVSSVCRSDQSADWLKTRGPLMSSVWLSKMIGYPNGIVVGWFVQNTNCIISELHRLNDRLSLNQLAMFRLCWPELFINNFCDWRDWAKVTIITLFSSYLTHCFLIRDTLFWKQARSGQKIALRFLFKQCLCNVITVSRDAVKSSVPITVKIW